MLMTDDRLIDTMRDFVTAANRLQYLSRLDSRDLGLLEQANATHSEAARAFQEALVSRGWRRPGFH